MHPANLKEQYKFGTNFYTYTYLYSKIINSVLSNLPEMKIGTYENVFFEKGQFWKLLE